MSYQNLGRIVVLIVVITMSFGIGSTYERYRGTDHSRVPSRPVVSPVTFTPTNGSPVTRLLAQPAVAATDSSLASVGRSDSESLPPRPATPQSLGNTTDELILYPTITKGMRTPFDLYRYFGRGRSSFGSPVLPMRFEQWLTFHRKQKPQLMDDVRQYMAGRFDFSGKSMAGQYMTSGKPVMAGPISRLPDGVDSFEELAVLTAAEIRERDLFPFKPLAHPLQSVAHMVFPPAWIQAHPEHLRIDVDLDIPQEYLPEFPPPMFLTTHKELGDVTNGQEVTLDNFFEIFDGLITPEQMEGLKELLRPSPTTWFNHTDHRITESAIERRGLFRLSRQRAHQWCD